MLPGRGRGPAAYPLPLRWPPTPPDHRHSSYPTTRPHQLLPIPGVNPSASLRVAYRPTVPLPLLRAGRGPAGRPAPQTSPRPSPFALLRAPASSSASAQTPAPAPAGTPPGLLPTSSPRQAACRPLPNYAPAPARAFTPCAPSATRRYVHSSLLCVALLILYACCAPVASVVAALARPSAHRTESAATPASSATPHSPASRTAPVQPASPLTHHGQPGGTPAYPPPQRRPPPTSRYPLRSAAASASPHRTTKARFAEY